MKVAKLTLLHELPARWRGYVVALWQCDCGSKKAIPIFRVTSGNAKSCGCLKTRHGYATDDRSPEYVAWQAMRARCAAKRGRDYETYSARGIKVCERWRAFPAFLADMGPRPTEKHSLGRIDNNGGYTPENCQWETPQQQLQNTSKSYVWHVLGVDFGSCRDAAKHFGVDHKTIRYWVKKKREGSHAAPRY